MPDTVSQIILRNVTSYPKPFFRFAGQSDEKSESVPHLVLGFFRGIETILAWLTYPDNKGPECIHCRWNHFGSFLSPLALSVAMQWPPIKP